MPVALLRFVPERLCTQSLCMRMVRRNPDNLAFVPLAHYKDPLFAKWSGLYWHRIASGYVLGYQGFFKEWHFASMNEALAGAGSGAEVSGLDVDDLMVEPWKDSAVILRYAKTSQDLRLLKPEDLDGGIFDVLIGRNREADFVNRNHCDEVYDILLSNRFRHLGLLWGKLSEDTIAWLSKKGYFETVPARIYELETHQITEPMILKILPTILFLEGERIIQHPSFLRLYLQYHNVPEDESGRFIVGLMYELLEAFGPYGRPIQSMLKVHGEAMCALDGYLFTEFILDGLMSLRNQFHHKGLSFHQMLMDIFKEELEYIENVGATRYMEMIWSGSLNHILACSLWARWYFKIHTLEEILAGVNSEAVWPLAQKYASRESLMQHERGRRMLLEQDMAI